MISVLKTFALELNSAQLDAVLDRFQAKVQKFLYYCCFEIKAVLTCTDQLYGILKDEGDGLGRVISYPDFVKAVVKVKEQHPFTADRDKMMEDGWRRDSAKVRASFGVGSLSGIDHDGR